LEDIYLFLILFIKKKLLPLTLAAPASEDKRVGALVELRLSLAASQRWYMVKKCDNGI
jgi:hypothetical protein